MKSDELMVGDIVLRKGKPVDTAKAAAKPEANGGSVNPHRHPF